MIRIQVYFDPEDMRMIEYLAAREGVKKARMMRMVVKKAYLKNETKAVGVHNSLEAISKIGAKGPKDLSENLSEYLYGNKSDFADK